METKKQHSSPPSAEVHRKPERSGTYPGILQTPYFDTNTEGTSHTKIRNNKETTCAKEIVVVSSVVARYAAYTLIQGDTPTFDREGKDAQGSDNVSSFSYSPDSPTHGNARGRNGRMM